MGCLQGWRKLTPLSNRREREKQQVCMVFLHKSFLSLKMCSPPIFISRSQKIRVRRKCQLTSRGCYYHCHFQGRRTKLRVGMTKESPFSTAGKIIAWIVTSCLFPVAEEILPESQCSFNQTGAKWT